MISEPEIKNWLAVMLKCKRCGGKSIVDVLQQKTLATEKYLFCPYCGTQTVVSSQIYLLEGEEHVEDAK